MRLELIKFHSDEEKKKYDKKKKSRRRWAFFFTTLILILLAIALASPFSITQTREKGNPNMVILLDNSSSMDLYEKNLGENLKAKLETDFPISIRSLGSKERSALGDGILNTMQGDDNLFLITDGRSTHGRDLGDILRLAYEVNSTISNLLLEPLVKDASVQILGPDQQIEQVRTDYLIALNQVGNPTCEVTVKSNGNVVERKTTKEDFIVPRQFPQGVHKLEAIINCDQDHFPDNNVFYKTVKILPKPKIFFLDKQTSPLDHVFTRYYRYTREEVLPADLDPYDAVVINDYSSSELTSSVTRLTNYVTEGNGLMVVGGKNSFDLGGYKNSLLEAMLPVQVGVSDSSQEGTLNIVVLIDISGSTGSSFGAGSDNKKVDVEKSLAIDILKDIRPNDKVGVIAFNTQSYTVSKLSPLSDKRDIVNQIARLKDSGGTEIFKGLRSASQMLAFADGGKNIVVISDGYTWFAPTVLSFAETLSKAGVKIHTVGVGDNTDKDFLGKLARVGGGVFLDPDEHQQLKILFDNEEAGETDRMKLTSLNRNHFITKGLELTARVNGFNQVVAKQSARNLVTTFEGSTIVAEHRFGLGRIVAMAGDDGTAWAGELFDQRNSLLWTRMVNYAIGNPTRKNRFDIQMKDAFLGDAVEVRVKSDKFPKHKLVTFTKVSDNIYTGFFTPKEPGFYDILGSSVAVNYPKEYLKIGIDPELEGLVSSTGGKTFTLSDIKELSEFIKSNSVRVKQSITYWRWPFVVAAMVIFLFQLFVRRYKR
jgi:Mg-chelatase subunit ChlD